MTAPQPNYLLAEDTDLQYAIIELMKAHLPNWGERERDWLVKVKRADGVDDALNHDTLFEQLKESGLKVLGVVIDADDNPKGRWQSIRDFCQKVQAQAPAQCPGEGFIVDQIKGPNGVVAKFGAWIMPDNKSEGMLEDFCFKLIPPGNEVLLVHAASAIARAKELAAPFIKPHERKALMHTWLAWQNPPGYRMGRAIAHRILYPDGQYAKPFVTWFRKLYGL
jgi:hypothetical protein